MLQVLRVPGIVLSNASEVVDHRQESAAVGAASRAIGLFANPLLSDWSHGYASDHRDDQGGLEDLTISSVFFERI